MLPQHLVYKNELNREYVITLARNDETPWWWSEKIETCRSVLKCSKWKLYRCICWLIVEVILRNARCNDEIHTWHCSQNTCPLLLSWCSHACGVSLRSILISPSHVASSPQGTHQNFYMLLTFRCALTDSAIPHRHTFVHIWPLYEMWRPVQSPVYFSSLKTRQPYLPRASWSWQMHNTQNLTRDRHPWPPPTRDSNPQSQHAGPSHAPTKH